MQNPTNVSTNTLKFFNNYPAFFISPGLSFQNSGSKLEKV